jgi:FMN phosphatase YigB (HAD superfamily)
MAGSVDLDTLDLDSMVAESIETHPHGTDHFGDLLAKYGFSDPAGAATAVRWYRENRFHGLEMFPCAADVLRTVRLVSRVDHDSSRRPIGIITNGPTDVQRAKISLLGVRQLVDFVIISDEFGTAKPDRTIFDHALELAGVAPEHAVFIGDSPEFDIAGAQMAGIPSVWVNRHGTTWTAGNPAPSRIVQSIEEIVPMVCVD